MRTAPPAANPFALMLDPQSVLDAMERSDRLAHLKRHVCHPLDKPMIGRRQDAGLEAYDESVEGDDDEVMED